MSARCCSSPGTNSGVTLIEVLASLTLMSRILGVAVQSVRRHQRQVDRCAQIQTAVTAADTLLQEWTGAGIPANARGAVEDNEDLSWRTHVIDTRHRERLGIDLVQLQLYDNATDSSETPLVSVVVATPTPEWPITPRSMLSGTD